MEMQKAAGIMGKHAAASAHCRNKEGHGENEINPATLTILHHSAQSPKLICIHLYHDMPQAHDQAEKPTTEHQKPRNLRACDTLVLPNNTGDTPNKRGEYFWD